MQTMSNKWRAFSVVSTLALLIVFAQSAGANHASEPVPPGQPVVESNQLAIESQDQIQSADAEAAPGPLVVTTRSSGVQESIRIARQTDAQLTNSQTFVDVPGTVVSVAVPAGHTDLLVMRFSAESACYGSNGYCSARILVDGFEAGPNAGVDFAFDSSGGGRELSNSWESHAMERSYCVGAGTHVVRVQQRTTAAGTFLRLDDYSLSVTRSHTCNT